MYIDSHTHLNSKRLLNIGTPADIVKRATEAGVESMLTICCRVSDEFPDILNLAQEFDNVWCSVGTHPHEADDEAEQAVSQEKLIALANSDPNIIGIGETGLDYFYKHSTPENQQKNFRKHVRVCLETGLPLIIHSRDAEEDTIRIIKEEGGNAENLKGVMHCFSSSRALGEAALELGLYISFSGIVTFKKSADLQDFAKDVPLDLMLIETDAPYLAPEPFRGKINEPAMMVHTGQFLAKLHAISEEEFATHTKNNFFSLFEKAKAA